MNCFRWSMGDVSSHGIESLLAPKCGAKCYPCPRTVLLPLSLDRTNQFTNSPIHQFSKIKSVGPLQHHRPVALIPRERGWLRRLVEDEEQVVARAEDVIQAEEQHAPRGGAVVLGERRRQPFGARVDVQAAV